MLMKNNKKIILYIAVSIDGFIAKNNGDVSWLYGDDKNSNSDMGYNELLNEIDTIIMGNKTYKEISTKLSINNWPYQNKNTYVFTKTLKDKDNKNNIIFVNDDIKNIITNLNENNNKKNIWLCGGSDIIQQFLNNNLIDEFRLFTIPVILGSGIRLFNNNEKNIEKRLKLQKVENINGIIFSYYKK